MSSVLWYYATGGETRGPMEWAALLADARAGRFGPSDWVWTAGFADGWRKASTIGTLFPPPDAADAGGKAPGADASAPDAPPASEAPPEGPSVRIVLRAERSPFVANDAEASKPGPPRCLAALVQSWTNARTILFAPFSFRRWIVFSVAAFLLVLGAQTEFVSPAEAPEAVERLGLRDVAGSGVFALPSDLVVSLSSPERQPEAVGKLAAAFRETARQARAWLSATPARPRILAGMVALFFVLALLRAWFLAKGWTLLLHGVYRRDEPSFLSWADSSAASRPLFLGLAVLRAAFLAGYLLCARGLLRLAWAAPASAPLPRGPLGSLLAALAVLALFDSLSVSAVRDLVAPRVCLARESFLRACRSLASDAGLWLVRWFFVSLLFPFLAGIAAMAAMVFASLFGAPFFPVFFALLGMPVELWRTLWGLALLFRLRPGLSSAVPPRRAEVLLARMDRREARK